MRKSLTISGVIIMVLGLFGYIAFQYNPWFSGLSRRILSLSFSQMHALTISLSVFGIVITVFGIVLNPPLKQVS